MIALATLAAWTVGIVAVSALTGLWLERQRRRTTWRLDPRDGRGLPPRMERDGTHIACFVLEPTHELAADASLPEPNAPYVIRQKQTSLDIGS